MREGKIEEILCPGAHSDVGGGYPSSLMHDADNSFASRNYLHLMYEKANQNGVPFSPDISNITAKAGKNTVRLSDYWSLDTACHQRWQILMEYYQDYPMHRLYYKLYRQARITLQAMIKLNKGGDDTSIFTENGRDWFLEKATNDILAFVARASDDTNRKGMSRGVLEKMMEENKTKIELESKGSSFDLIKFGGEFYDEFVHKSIYPWNASPGMWPQVTRGAANFGGTYLGSGLYRRQMHNAKPIDFREFNQSKEKKIGDDWRLFRQSALRLGYELFDYDFLTPEKFKDDDHGL